MGMVNVKKNADVDAQFEQGFSFIWILHGYWLW